MQCSSCGAPVDLAQGFECGHCGSPISVLDADAVEKTLRSLDEADARRSGDPAEKQARAALASLEAMKTTIPEEQWGTASLRRHRVTGSLTTDLLSASLEMIFGGR